MRNETQNKNLERLAKCFPHLTEHPFVSKLKNKNIFDTIKGYYSQLQYPNHPNWSYCIPLIPSFEYDNKIVDIGVHLMDDWILEGKLDITQCLSNNIVYSEEPSDYGSGFISAHKVPGKQLMLKLYELKIITRQDLVNQFDFNGNLLKFYYSDLTSWDFQNFVNGKTCL